MKCGGVILLAALALLLNSHLSFGQGTAGFSTLQNSTLSIPATAVVSAIRSNDVAIHSTNGMLSGVSPVSAQGGSVSVATSQEWVRRHRGDLSNPQCSPLDIALRPDGSVVVCGYSYGRQTSDDFITLCYAADGTALWTNLYDSPSHLSDTADLLAVNDLGEIWVAGTSKRASPNAHLKDIVLIKYNHDGFPLWTNRVSSFETNSAYPFGLEVDRNGNTYLSYWGIYERESPLFDSDFVETAIVKHNSDGNLLWSKHFMVAAPDSGQAIYEPNFMTIDGNGHLLLAGESGRNHWNTGISIMKFAHDGSALWTNHHPFPFIVDFDAFSLGSSNCIIAVGTRYFSGEPTEVILKCSAEGLSLWTNQLVAPKYDGGNVPQVQTDSDGNSFVIAGSPNSSALSASYQVVKINAAGVPLWTNQTIRLGITNSLLSCSAVDHSGNLYLSGYAPLGTNSYSDYVITKYSSDGRAVWTNRFDGTAGRSDIPIGMGVDDSGNVFLTGRSQSQSGEEIATVKYSDSLVYSPPSDFVGTDFVSLTLIDHLGAGTNAQVEIIVSPDAFQYMVFPGSITFTPAGVELYGEGIPNENPVILEASHDMKSWQRVATNTPEFGFVMFIDSTPGGARRFYRMSQRP